MNYAEMVTSSNFSFLRGASHPEELSKQAAELNLAGFGIADRNSVAGVVRAHSIAKEKNVRLAVGARLAFSDGTPDIVAYPKDRHGWARLMRLLTVGKRRAPKGECHFGLADLLEWCEGLNLILIPSTLVRQDALAPLLLRLREAVCGSLWLAAQMRYAGDDERRLSRLAALETQTRVPLLACNDVLYHVPERRALQDVVTCVREHTTIDKAGRLLAANAERHLKTPKEMARLFHKYPAAIEESIRLLDACAFSLDQLKPSYPLETREGFATPQEALVHYTEEGAKARYPEGVPDKIRKAIDYELALVERMKYAPYFLTVHDIVRFARSKGILCQGRGSAANSTICYCLGVTPVDPMISDLLFERFISENRGEPPDIDIDFEHERREEVIQYIYGKYGRERAAMTGVTICYRGRSAVRDVAKVFGLSEDVGALLAKTLWGWSSSGVSGDQARQSGLDPADPVLAKVLALSRELIDFPRHLSQHVGGFVITEGRVDEIVPVENAAMDDRTVIEWNKDDIEALHIMKVDVLGLGMLSCLRRAFEMANAHYGHSFTLTSDLPREEKETYEMLSRADSVGVFQVESRAQMSMLPRLKPKVFYDLVIEVAIVRPGPIQGDMVHPYLRRREGKEAVFYPSPSSHHGSPDELRNVLQKTLGVPLFQEQAMRVAIVAAKFEPDEADRLRRAMATFRRVGTIQNFRITFIENMTRRGYPQSFAEGCFRQIEGFGEYGFPESHAASFALLVYASGWLKCRYPDVFAAALLNSQPMGFYAPAQIVRDAQEHGVEARAPDINHSDWDCTLESGTLAPPHPRHVAMKDHIRSSRALRLGFRQIDGFSKEDGLRIAKAREAGAFASIRDLWLRTGLAPSALKRLAEADAFRSLGIGRRQALWDMRALRRIGDKDDLPLFARTNLSASEPDADLPLMKPAQQVVEDYRFLHLSLKGHPVSFLRAELARRGAAPCAELYKAVSGTRLMVAGLVLVRQRPGSGKTVFITLEDETGIGNIIVWQRVFQAFRPVVMGARLVFVQGSVQNENNVVHLVADHLTDVSFLTEELGRNEASMPGATRIVQKVMPKGRNFH